MDRSRRRRNMKSSNPGNTCVPYNTSRSYPTFSPSIPQFFPTAPIFPQAPAIPMPFTDPATSQGFEAAPPPKLQPPNLNVPPSMYNFTPPKPQTSYFMDTGQQYPIQYIPYPQYCYPTFQDSFQSGYENYYSNYSPYYQPQPIYFQPWTGQPSFPMYPPTGQVKAGSWKQESQPEKQGQETNAVPTNPTYYMEHNDEMYKQQENMVADARDGNETIEADTRSLRKARVTFADETSNQATSMATRADEDGGPEKMYSRPSNQREDDLEPDSAGKKRGKRSKK